MANFDTIVRSNVISGLTYKNGVFKLHKDIVFNSTTYNTNVDFSINLLPSEVFDGNHHTITISNIGASPTPLFAGFFTTDVTVTAATQVTVKDLKFKFDALVSTAGGLFKANENWFIVKNCHVSGFLGNTVGGSGGIVGAGCADFRVYNSSFTGDLNGATLGQGGIAGTNCLRFTISGCKFNGLINCVQAGGIVGQSCDNFTITKCESKGDITSVASNAGGIVGGGSNDTGAGVVGPYAATITHCKYEGEIVGGGAGGILGAYSYADAIIGITISKCRVQGNIVGAGAGGIVGARASGAPTAPADAGVTGAPYNISYCVVKGDLLGQYAGGICGQYFGINNNSAACTTALTITSNVTVKYCKFEGDIIGANCGGIIGDSAFEDTDFAYTNATAAVTLNVTANIQNCKSVGKILGSNCAGIVGSNALSFTPPNTIPPVLTLNFTVNACVHNGDILGSVSAGIVGYNLYLLTNPPAGTTVTKINITNNAVFGKIGTGYNANAAVLASYSGNNKGATLTIAVNNCYSTGYIASGSAGIAGVNAATTDIANAAITNCYAYGHLQLGSPTFAAAYGITLANAGNNTGVTTTSCFSRGTQAQNINVPSAAVNGSSLSGIKGKHQTLLTTGWKSVHDSYPVLTVFKSKPWHCYDKFNEVPRLRID